MKSKRKRAAMVLFYGAEVAQLLLRTARVLPARPYVSPERCLSLTTVWFSAPPTPTPPQLPNPPNRCSGKPLLRVCGKVAPGATLRKAARAKIYTPYDCCVSKKESSTVQVYMCLFTSKDGPK